LKPVGFEIINLGGHEVININHLLRMMEERIGKNAQVIHRDFHLADVHTNQADVTWAGEILGREPRVDFEKGVTQLVDWYMRQ
jgi:nucleoside-diphosphate-sugar epimerase